MKLRLKLVAFWCVGKKCFIINKVIKLRLNKILLLSLVIISSIFYLVNLGKLPLEDYDEATYAQVLKESVQKENYLSFTPLETMLLTGFTYFGNNWFEKPPLQFWLTAASAKVFGFNEFALRLPSALFGILTVILVYLIVEETAKNKLAAFLAASLLILMPFFLSATKNFRMDVPVSAAILASFYFFTLSLKKKAFLIWSGAALAVGVLFKSIIAFLALPIILIWSLLWRRWDWIKNRYFIYSAITSVIIISPWHLYQSFKFGSAFWQNYLGYHIFARATQNILGSKITVSYFISLLWKASEPLIPIFLTAIILILFFRKRLARTSKELFYLAWTALLSALFIFIVFSLVKTKLITYYTPMYPFLAIFIASIFSLAIDSFKPQWFKWLGGTVILVIIINAGFSTVTEAFISPQIYISKASGDEKVIGLYLKDKAKNNEEINLFNWNHHNTIRYYSNHMTESLQFNSTRQPLPPFWLVLPSELLKVNPDLKKITPAYSGQYLTLIRFDKK